MKGSFVTGETLIDRPFVDLTAKHGEFLAYILEHGIGRWVDRYEVCSAIGVRWSAGNDLSAALASRSLILARPSVYKLKGGEYGSQEYRILRESRARHVLASLGGA